MRIYFVKTLKNFHLESNDLLLKFGYSEKATKFEKNFHLKFDVTEMFSNFVAFSEYPNFNKVNGNGNVRGFSHVFMKIVFLEF